ncbi:MAG: hypothetical protein WC690_05825, partial [bacterium]
SKSHCRNGLHDITLYAQHLSAPERQKQSELRRILGVEDPDAISEFIRRLKAARRKESVREERPEAARTL